MARFRDEWTDPVDQTNGINRGQQYNALSDNMSVDDVNKMVNNLIHLKNRIVDGTGTILTLSGEKVASMEVDSTPQESGTNRLVTSAGVANALKNFTPSGGNEYDDTELRNLIDKKVDKVDGKQLSTNDFTNDYKTKLDGLNNYDDTELSNKIDNHINNKNNPHSVTKEQLNLGNVDNTSDMDKPISRAVQEALDNIASSSSDTKLPESWNYTVDGVHYFNVVSKFDDKYYVVYDRKHTPLIAGDDQTPFLYSTKDFKTHTLEAPMYKFYNYISATKQPTIYVQDMLQYNNDLIVLWFGANIWDNSRGYLFISKRFSNGNFASNPVYNTTSYSPSYTGTKYCFKVVNDKLFISYDFRNGSNSSSLMTYYIDLTTDYINNLSGFVKLTSTRVFDVIYVDGEYIMLTNNGVYKTSNLSSTTYVSCNFSITSADGGSIRYVNGKYVVNVGGTSYVYTGDLGTSMEQVDLGFVKSGSMEYDKGVLVFAKQDVSSVAVGTDISKLKEISINSDGAGYTTQKVIYSNGEFSIIGSKSGTGNAIITSKVPEYSLTDASNLSTTDVNKWKSKLGVTSSSLSLLDCYPVGSIYLTIATNTTGSSSPASFFGGTWERLPDGYALWTASSGAGNTISAGLPNVTGQITAAAYGTGSASGAFTGTANGGAYTSTANLSDANRRLVNFNFNAARSSGVYGASSTVQPPAYKVYAWKRTA